MGISSGQGPFSPTDQDPQWRGSLLGIVGGEGGILFGGKNGQTATGLLGALRVSKV